MNYRFLWLNLFFRHSRKFNENSQTCEEKAKAKQTPGTAPDNIANHKKSPPMICKYCTILPYFLNNLAFSS